MPMNTVVVISFARETGRCLVVELKPGVTMRTSAPPRTTGNRRAIASWYSERIATEAKRKA